MLLIFDNTYLSWNAEKSCDPILIYIKKHANNPFEINSAFSIHCYVTHTYPKYQQVHTPGGTDRPLLGREIKVSALGCLLPCLRTTGKYLEGWAGTSKKWTHTLPFYHKPQHIQVSSSYPVFRRLKADLHFYKSSKQNLHRSLSMWPSINILYLWAVVSASPCQDAGGATPMLLWWANSCFLCLFLSYGSWNAAYLIGVNTCFNDSYI